MIRALIALLPLVAAATAGICDVNDETCLADATSLIQGEVETRSNNDEDSMYTRWNGKDKWATGPKPLVPPRELAGKASNYDIPCLAGVNLIKPGTPNGDSWMLSREVTGFRLRKSTDNKNRVMVVLTGRSNSMLFTRKADMTFKGATHFYDPIRNTKGPVGEIHMSSDTAAVRMTQARMLVDTLAHARYEVLSYSPSCPQQQPIQKDKTGNGKALYSFARITKPVGVKGNWRVVRVNCYTNGEPRGEEAYTLKQRPDGIEVISPKKGLIGLVYRHPESVNDYTDAWLTKGEDSILFSAVIMTTQAPQSPTG